MTQVQTNNFVKHNLDGIKRIEDMLNGEEELYRLSFQEILKHKNWADIGAINNSLKLFVCTACGTPVNMRTLDYYNFEVERVRCYQCQETNKLTQPNL